MEPMPLEAVPFPPRYSEIAWDLVESGDDLLDLTPEVLRGFNNELVIYGLVGLIRSTFAALEACNFIHDAAAIKGFHLETHYEEYERQLAALEDD